MIFVSPLLVQAASQFGPSEIAAVMLLGLLAGATMARGSPLKGIAMTLLGLICGLFGTDVTSGAQRFTFGQAGLSDGIELGALCMGLFGVADFLMHGDRKPPDAAKLVIRFRDVWPSAGDLKKSLSSMLRGTAVGTLFGAMPGTGPTITTFIAYAIERRLSRTPERFGKGAIEGVAAPEAAAHSKTQVDFIPTLSLGIPGDPVMALILGALIIKGVQPGPQMISEHPDLFWGLVASFWIGNILLLVLNMPFIGVWVKLLRMPYRILYPSAIFFICVGVYCARNDSFDVAEVAVIGIIGALLMALEFPLAPIVLGYVLGPLLEENLRRALTISRGNLSIFVERPICAVLIAATVLLLLAQVLAQIKRLRRVSMQENPA
jgi:TctA family transporter